MAARERDDISRLQDTNLWIKIDAVGMPKLSEFDEVEALYNTVRNEMTDAIKPDEILGAQYLSQKRTWVINVSCLDAKAKAISVGRVVVGTGSYGILDFQKTGLRKAETRISIHGIPHSVSDEEVAQWVDSRAERLTEVKRHQKKNRNVDSPFQHLYSGHRFCYVSKIINPFPRYSTYSIPDPTDTDSLIDIEVTVFHDGQSINCKSCKAEDHAFHECPHRITCYICGKKGHTKKWCRADKTIPSRESRKDIDQSVSAGLKAAREASNPSSRPYSTRSTRETGNDSHSGDEHSGEWASGDPDEAAEAVESPIDVENSEDENTGIGAKAKPPQEEAGLSDGSYQRRRTRSSRPTSTSTENTGERGLRRQPVSTRSARKRKNVLTPPDKAKPDKLHKDDGRLDDQRRRKDNG
ncbi:hypothetical protein Bbelb_253260 [Branchiostoma belcheri]|nr:hypothetical protein Bbelb_253260 [Branchiostoma belcheri]